MHNFDEARDCQYIVLSPPMQKFCTNLKETLSLINKTDHFEEIDYKATFPLLTS